MSAHCSHCTLATDYCICRHVQPCLSNAQLALLLHPNEPLRLTNTAPVIEQTLPQSQTWIWQRTEPPVQLIEMINDPQWQPWLIFPADRPELAARSLPWQPPLSDKKALFILPDGTWKEVRKMVRQSRWLDNVPILAFDPDRPTRYQLRRNPDTDHLCTAEIAAQLLTLSDQPEASKAIDNLLAHFLTQYHRWQHHLPPATH